MYVIGAALTERENVVYLLGRCQPTGSLALLAERVCLDEAVADTLPASTVAFVCLRLALEVVVMIVHLLLMLGTVLLVYGEPTAAGISAGTFGFVGHRVHLLAGKRKATGDHSSMASFVYCLNYSLPENPYA
jgi:hypothetical protein